jgi:hypothetical protein
MYSCQICSQVWRMRPAASYCLCTEVQQVATATLLTEQGSDIKLDSFHGDTLFHHASAKVSDFKTTGAHLYVCASLPSRSVFTKTQCPSAHVCPFAVCVSPVEWNQRRIRHMIKSNSLWSGCCSTIPRQCFQKLESQRVLSAALSWS